MNCPFNHKGTSPKSIEETFTLDEELQFLREVHKAKDYEERLKLYSTAILNKEAPALTSDELTWAGRIAWRNHSKCIGRLFWRSLIVRDKRSVEKAEDISENLKEHLLLAQNEGNVRSVLTVFAPPNKSNEGFPRIWNNQLCAYAGYNKNGKILGDPKNAKVTELALKLGWIPPKDRSPFDLLPWIISGYDGIPHVFDIPKDLVKEVLIRHPKFIWFEELKLKWYAVPVVSDMKFHVAGADYTAAPFNGWYMGTEIGARDLSDENRYNLLPIIAEKLELDRTCSRTLWKDRALLELNLAILYSYDLAGVKIVDHHTASLEFIKFNKKEKSQGRDVSARWDWIIPPMSPATTEVFHTPMSEFRATPNFKSN
jgi:nitric-oxide synthase, bacterial